MSHAWQLQAVGSVLLMLWPASLMTVRTLAPAVVPDMSAKDLSREKLAAGLGNEWTHDGVLLRPKFIFNARSNILQAQPQEQGLTQVLVTSCFVGFVLGLKHEVTKG